MGTRSITVVLDEKGHEILSLYRQYDGYPSGHGQELADFLKPITITNGISGDPTNTANGMGCLAAQIVAHFKGIAAIRASIAAFTEALHEAGEKNVPVEIIKAVTEATRKLNANLAQDKRDSVGGFYVYPAGTRDRGEEYIYTVYQAPKQVGVSEHDRTPSVPHLKVQAGAMAFFGLPGSKQESMDVIYDGPAFDFNAKEAGEVEANLPTPKNDWADAQDAKAEKGGA